MEELYTWDIIGTLAGAAMITYLIVAYTKGLRWIRDMNTDIYAVIVATVVLLAAMGAQGQLVGWAPWVLAFFNAFLVAAAAGKLNDKAVTEYERQSTYITPEAQENIIPEILPPPDTSGPGNNSPGNTDGM